MVERKDDDSPVTIADREAELLLRQRIESAFPNDAIVGEEFGQREGTSGFRWILDPIDGTKSFVSGVPLYGTLVGVEYQQRSIVGSDLHSRAGRVRLCGRRVWGMVRARESARRRPREFPRARAWRTACSCTTQVDLFDRRDAGQVFRELQRHARITRTWGDCYGYLLVATGRAEVMIDPVMSVWDAAALQPILEEAGGTFTDWRGNRTIYHGEGIATNRRVLEEVLGHHALRESS